MLQVRKIRQQSVNFFNFGFLSCRHLWKSLRNISVQEANLFWILWRLWPGHVSVSIWGHQQRALVSSRCELPDSSQVSASREVTHCISDAGLGQKVSPEERWCTLNWAVRPPVWECPVPTCVLWSTNPPLRDASGSSARFLISAPAVNQHPCVPNVLLAVLYKDIAPLGLSNKEIAPLGIRSTPVTYYSTCCFGFNESFL